MRSTRVLASAELVAPVWKLTLLGVMGGVWEGAGVTSFDVRNEATTMASSGRLNNITLRSCDILTLEFLPDDVNFLVDRRVETQ